MKSKKYKGTQKMTKKREVVLIMSKSWEQISSTVINKYIATHKVTKSFNTNATVTMYILYDILYKMNRKKTLNGVYSGINYDALKKWSMMGKHFCQFFKYLLDQKIIKRKQSEKINPRTNRPYAIWSKQNKMNSQYLIHSSVVETFAKSESVTITLNISQKNNFFFPTEETLERGLKNWRTKDDYSDYREPNQYQQLIMNRMKKLTGRIDPSFAHGRIYSNDWTNLSKQDRAMVRFDGKEIAEVFDIHNCFIQLLANKLTESGAVEPNELKAFSDLAYSGGFYQSIVKGTKYTRDDIKEKVMHFIFSNNWTKRHTIENQKKFVDGVATKRFDKDYVVQWLMVKNTFKTNYPSIFDYISSYEEIQIDGRKKSKLSVDLQWMENKYMLNGLMRNLQMKGIIKEPISLHDAIYLTKDQVTTELKQLIEEQWLKLVGHAKPVKNTLIAKENIIKQWMKETNSGDEMRELLQIAYQFQQGHIKSYREMA